MESNESWPIILRQIRALKKIGVWETAVLIGRSVGWLSEVENSTGTARLREEEFNRIVTLLDADGYRSMFKTWVANFKNQERHDKTYDGAIMRHIRLKKGLDLRVAAKLVGVSPGYLSRLENGICPVYLAVRQKIMVAYGYSPESFKNFSTDPIKSKAVSAKHKLDILMRKLSPAQAEAVFEFARTLIEKE